MNGGKKKRTGEWGKKKNWKWRTLTHHGVWFAPDYVPHGVKMKYDGEEVELTPPQEELATNFSRYIDNETHMGNPHFKKNFFKEFKKLLGKNHKIKVYDKCDFSPLNNYCKEQSELRKKMSKEEKQKLKKERDEITEKYGFATVDGRKVKLTGWAIEPPKLFVGRGSHPKIGTLKKRYMPEDITLNLDENAEIPPTPFEGHKWGKIIHNHEVQWIASYKDSITGKNKYVNVDSTSSIRGSSDKKKFEKARQLHKSIVKIRKRYMEDIKSKTLQTRQRATAIYLIDKLALRVGNKKGKEEADTVGCCSLRVEHVTLHKPNKIEFEFLGKDSVPYHNTVEVIPQAFKNFKIFLKGKKKGDLIFDKLSVTMLNKYLNTQMKGLTAKVFRTYNASICMEKQLEKYDMSKKILKLLKKSYFFSIEHL